jgi:hypothetical protein
MKNLNFILRFYILTGFFYFIYYLNAVSDKYLIIHFYHFFCLLLLGGVYIYLIQFKKNSNYSLNNLILLVAFISLVLIVCNNYLSYSLRGNYWVFCEADDLEYDKVARALNSSSMSFSGVLKSVGLSNLDFSDYGMIFYTSLIYSIFDSNLMINLSYWVLGLVSAKLMFELAGLFMEKKYAFFSTLLFFTSSFMGWFNSSGLKEPLMVFLVLLAFRNYGYYMNKSKKNRYLLPFSLSIIALLFFRPVLSIFIVFSTLATSLLSSNVKRFQKVLIIILSIILIYSFNFLFLLEFNRYTGGSYDQMVESLYSEEVIVGSNIYFNSIVQIISAIFGVFPTINPDVRLLLSFFYPSLILKIFLGLFYTIGIYIAFKKNDVIILPIVLFSLIEIVALIFTFEVLELRKNIPHFMMYYLLMFYAINKIEKASVKIKSNIAFLNYIYIFVSFTLIFFWNNR